MNLLDILPHSLIATLVIVLRAMVQRRSSGHSLSTPSRRSSRSHSRSSVSSTPQNTSLTPINLSLWQLLKYELALGDSSGSGPVISNNSEELINMARVPYYLEQFMGFGLLMGLCSYLTIFTLVPLKVVVHGWRKICSAVSPVVTPPPEQESTKSASVPTSDILTLVTLGCAIYLLLVVFGLDISRMYHDIRGQAHIKLYVMFGVLEVADKLLSSLGQDMFGLLFGSNHSGIKAVGVFLVTVTYLAVHGYVLVYQTVSLNVAANSYSNALLTLLLSNQFGELKGSVFKRFDKEGLFQVALADLCERYTLGSMIAVIATRNLLQVSQMSSDPMGQLIPNSWSAAWNNLVGGAIIGPAMVVLGSEIIVDWLKHCYIVKFNKFRPQVYKNFLHVLSADYLEAAAPGGGHDLSGYVVLMRRMGVPLFASVVSSLSMTMTDIKYLMFPVPGYSVYSILANTTVVVLVMLALVLIRLILGLVLLRSALRIHNSRPSDVVVLPGNPNPELSQINPSTRKYIYDVGEVVPERKPREKGGDLDSVMRFEMSSKRIW